MDSWKILITGWLHRAKFHGSTPVLPPAYTAVSMRLHQRCHGPSLLCLPPTPDFHGPTPVFHRPTPMDSIRKSREISTELHRDPHRSRPLERFFPRNYTGS